MSKRNSITETDREWVESNFDWLIKLFGYPQINTEPITISEKYFPETFRKKEFDVRNLILDLSVLLNLNAEKITYELLTDIRDTDRVPYELGSTPFETELEIRAENYKIYIANSLLKHPHRLVFNLVGEFIRIKLMESKLEYDTGDDTSLFIFIAAVYFGFGLILSANLIVRGRSDDGYWETKWNYVSDMPHEVMAFALAFYSKLQNQDSPVWSNELSPDFKLMFDEAIELLNEHPSKIIDKNELDANALFDEAHQLYESNRFEDANSTLQKILFLTKDEILRGEVYNSIGYNHLRLKQFEQGISYFKKAIEMIPDFGYANDNLGYALIRIGKPDEGKKYLDKALLSQNNDLAYSHRNFALYYEAIGDHNKAEQYFTQAFESIKFPVDLLEFHYGEFLIKQGNSDSGMKYLNDAAGKGEPEAIQKLNELEN